MTKPTKRVDDCFFSMFQAGTSSLQPQVQRVEVSDFGKGPVKITGGIIICIILILILVLISDP